MRKLKSNKILLIILIAMMPIHISMWSQDSTETNIKITGGMGQYADIQRGCEGNVLDKDSVPIRELAFSIDHKTKSPFRLGLNANYVRTKEENTYWDYSDYNQQYFKTWQSTDILMVNPFLNLEWQSFALGGGYVWTNRNIPDFDDEVSWSAYIRAGNIESTYFDVSLFHRTPFFCESVFKLGLGVNKNPAFKWWIGLGGIPQDKAGLIFKANIRIQKHLFVDPFVRLGTSEGVSECAIGLGLTYRLAGDN